MCNSEDFTRALGRFPVEIIHHADLALPNFNLSSGMIRSTQTARS